jgi:hypothetical protein
VETEHDVGLDLTHDVDRVAVLEDLAWRVKALQAAAQLLVVAHKRAKMNTRERVAVLGDVLQKLSEITGRPTYRLVRHQHRGRCRRVTSRRRRRSTASTRRTSRGDPPRDSDPDPALAVVVGLPGGLR